MGSLRKKIGWLMTVAFGMVFGGSRLLLSLPVANASTGDGRTNDRSGNRPNLSLQSLPTESRAKLQEQMLQLRQRYTLEQLNDAVFGLDENGNLEVIGSKTEFNNLMEQYAGPPTGSPTTV